MPVSIQNDFGLLDRRFELELAEGTLKVIATPPDAFERAVKKTIILVSCHMVR